ncbi:MAG TPA: DUF1835 domain-containing protein [Methylomirabilota bacterium]|nr:DUF1835 domain-containing protein [Methylomirabilota bacterium]
MPSTLHITNGDNAGGLMRQAGFEGDILPWRDVLHEGPVPAQLSLPELSALRVRFLADKGWGARDAIAAAFAARDAQLQSCARYDRIVLWFEHDLYDQLQLLQLLAWFAENDRGGAQLFLLCIGSYPGVADFGGLGELRVEQIESLWGREQPVTEVQLELGCAGFQAVGAADPQALNAFLAQDLAALPYLRAALGRLQQEFPWRGDGLARSQRQLLQSVMSSGGDLPSMFRACAALEEARYLGDTVFLDYALKLAMPPEPALQFLDGEASPVHPSSAWHRPLMLTSFGRRLLTGNGDLIRAVGINRWIGGVHLMGDRWRYDPETATVTETRRG